MEQVSTGLLTTEQLVIGFLATALFALALKGATIGIAYLKTKAELIKDESARKIVLTALDDVDSLIKKNISNAETTLKPAILQDIADGKVDKSELSNLSVIVRDNVLKQLSIDSTEVLNKSVGDVNSYLAITIEDTLSKMKVDETNAIVTKTVIPEVNGETIMDSSSSIETPAADDEVVAGNVATQTTGDATAVDISALQQELADTKAKLETIQSVVANSTTSSIPTLV